MGKITIMYVRGVEGNSLYINDYRVCGPKPWGGGKIIHQWDVEESDIIDSLKTPQERHESRIKENSG